MILEGELKGEWGWIMQRRGESDEGGELHELRWSLDLWTPPVLVGCCFPIRHSAESRRYRSRGRSAAGSC